MDTDNCVNIFIDTNIDIDNDIDIDIDIEIDIYNNNTDASTLNSVQACFLLNVIAYKFHIFKKQYFTTSLQHPIKVCRLNVFCPDFQSIVHLAETQQLH